MHRTTRLLVLATALMSLFAVTASTAGAVTWHNTGSTNFTATGGSTTLTASGVNLTCTSSDVTGATGMSFVGATWTIASGAAQFTGCNMAGTSATVTCTYTSTATSWVAGPPSVTSGNVDVFCTSSVAGTPFCITEGQTPGTYTNPTGTTKGRGNLPTSSTVVVTNAPAASCPLGNGVTVHLTPMTLTLTAGTGSGTLGPVVTRTP